MRLEPVRYIELGTNKMKLIDENAFGRLKNLQTRYTEHNLCISNGRSDRIRVLHLVAEIKKKCQSEKDIARRSDFTN